MSLAGNMWQALLALGGAYFAVTIVSAFTNPLRKYPGPWHSIFTDLVLKYHTIMGRKPLYVHELHEKYGSVVRISPEQVDICDLSALQHMSRADFHKTAFYKIMSIDEDNVFNTGDPALHKRERRLLSGPLSESGLKSVVDIVDDKVKFAIRRIEEEMKQSPSAAADVFKWVNFMTTDVIAKLTFGESFGMLESGKKHQYFRDMESAAPVFAIRSLFPIVRWLMSVGFPVPGAKEAMIILRRLREGAEDRLATYRKQCERQESESGEAPSPTLFTKLYNAAGGDKGLTQTEILGNAQLYLVAGSDTTANTLTYIIWSVCKRPEVKKRLLAELRSLPSTEVSAVFGDDGKTEQVEVDVDHEELLRNAPYLNAIIDETLRLYPATPAPLPRHVPKEGMNLAGHWFPGGTVVSSQSWSFHRNADIFPNPEEWNPDRWEHPTKEMKDAHVPFGSGVRICLGMHLAKMEMRLGAARFFLRYPEAQVSTADGFSDKDMEQIMYFLAFPKGKRCLIQGN